MQQVAEQPKNELELFINNSIPLLKAAPEILVENEKTKTKALIVGNNIIEASKNGLTPELDERAMKYLANIETAKNKMKDQRSPITQIMDSLKKMYTTIEAELDIKNADSIPGKVQSIRNSYAKKVAQEREEKRLQEELNANKKQEEIKVASEVIIGFGKFFNEFLLNRKSLLNKKFNNLTLDGFKEKDAEFRQWQPEFKTEYVNGYEHNYRPIYISIERVKEIVSSNLPGLIEKASKEYVSEMLLLKNELVDKLESKHQELQEEHRLMIQRQEAEQKAKEEEAKRQADIEKANAEEKKRLEEEARIKKEEEDKRLADLKAEQEKLAAEKARREKEEEERLAKEADEAQKKAELDAQLKMQGDQTMVMFEKEAALAETSEMPEARQGYEIEVLHPVGFTQIFAIWFERVGKDLPVDKLGNTKLDQMKAWAEKEAHKTGEKINSKFLKYEETFKAVNRKKV